MYRVGGGLHLPRGERSGVRDVGLLVVVVIGVWLWRRGRHDRIVKRAGETQTWAAASTARFIRAPRGRFRGRRRGLR